MEKSTETEDNRLLDLQIDCGNRGNHGNHGNHGGSGNVCKEIQEYFQGKN